MPVVAASIALAAEAYSLAALGCRRRLKTVGDGKSKSKSKYTGTAQSSILASRRSLRRTEIDSSLASCAASSPFPHPSPSHCAAMSRLLQTLPSSFSSNRALHIVSHNFLRSASSTDDDSHVFSSAKNAKPLRYYVYSVTSDNKRSSAVKRRQRNENRVLTKHDLVASARLRSVYESNSEGGSSCSPPSATKRAEAAKAKVEQEVWRLIGKVGSVCKAADVVQGGVTQRW